MKASKKLFLGMLFFGFSGIANSQVLISLVFGEALNSEKVEFGLVGGINRSDIYTLDDTEMMNNFNIGFYFHILMKGNSYLSTGVLVKSNVGAKGMPTFPTGNEDLDLLYADGTQRKEINYFYVPIMFQQRFNNRWLLEGGFQLGLRNKAENIFTVNVEGGDLKYTIDAKDDYKRLDAGLIGGLGYKLKKKTKSMAVGINYYYGLADVSAVADVNIKNSSFYFYFKIPIGTGKKEIETQSSEPVN